MLAERLGVPGNSKRLAFARREKHQMQKALANRGLKNVHSRIANSPAAAEEAAKAFGLPVILKPLMSAGAEDVSICESGSEVEDAARRILGKINVLGVPNDAVLIQELLEGTEYIVNAVTLQGHHRISEVFRCCCKEE